MARTAAGTIVNRRPAAKAANSQPRVVNMHEAKTHLSRLVDGAAQGRTFVIAKAGKPMVRVMAIEPAVRPARRFGVLQGQGTLPEGFDRFMEDEIATAFGMKP